MAASCGGLSVVNGSGRVCLCRNQMLSPRVDPSHFALGDSAQTLAKLTRVGLSLGHDEVSTPTLTQARHRDF